MSKKNIYLKFPMWLKQFAEIKANKKVFYISETMESVDHTT